MGKTKVLIQSFNFYNIFIFQIALYFSGNWCISNKGGNGPCYIFCIIEIEPMKVIRLMKSRLEECWYSIQQFVGLTLWKTTYPKLKNQLSEYLHELCLPQLIIGYFLLASLFLFGGRGFPLPPYLSLYSHIYWLDVQRNQCDSYYNLKYWKL